MPATLLLRCIRCGELAEMDPTDPFMQEICLACFDRWLALGPASPAGRRFTRWQKHRERHPTYKALSAALSSLESVPHGTLDVSEVD